jgi:BirA family transcriptional regulator, biotin operon repressor / biotin---[acetyl-CoA-carboxylase] ligase
VKNLGLTPQRSRDLAPMPAPNTFLDADEIRQSSFVRHVEIYDELGSTNDRAAELAGILETPLPALVATRRQTAGRGRGTNRWWTADGALTFSLLIDTSMHGVITRDWPRLSLATAVAICDALSAELWRNRAKLHIKWPNDVMLNGSKIAGILVESPANTATRQRLVIGIGININNAWQLAPPDSEANGIALCDVTNETHDLGSVLHNTLKTIRNRVQELSEQQPRLPRAWQKLCWLTDKAVTVGAGDRWTEGVCNGIDPSGALVVKTSSGSQRFYSGSVKVL